MRTIEFTVPTEVIVEFADAMTTRNLTNSITGSTEDGDLVIDVEYEKNESDFVNELEEILEQLSNELEEGGEEDDENDE